jgi:hypothetical protein
VSGQLVADPTGLSGIDHLDGHFGVAGIRGVTDPAGDTDGPIAEYRDKGLVTPRTDVRQPPLHR